MRSGRTHATRRGVIDAVFADSADGGYDLVDWKTGRPPEQAAEQAAAAVQLGAYRLAWADLAAVPLAALGFLSPVICALAMGLSDLIVIGNALRLRRWKG